MSDVYVCKESAAFEYGGDMVVVQKGFTRVRAGHPMLDQHPELFEEITVHYDVEQATAAPGEKRSVSLPEPKSAAAPLAPVDDVEALRQQAADLGVKVDKRWGADKLRQEIDKANEE